MTGIYAAEKKSRRRDSCFRPYIGDYLDRLGSRSEKIRDGIFRILDFYDSKEKVIFTDPECSQVNFIF
jgi:hypothetical protein